MTALTSKPRRIINRPLVELIELVRVVENDIHFKCPSTTVENPYKVVLYNNGARLHCECVGFNNHHKKHHPTIIDTAHHCKHIEAAIAFLDCSLTIEEMFAEDDAYDKELDDAFCAWLAEQHEPDEREPEQPHCTDWDCPREIIPCCPICKMDCDWIKGEKSDALMCEDCGDVTSEYESECDL